MFVEVRLRYLTAERAAKRRRMMLEFIMGGKCRSSEIKLELARDAGIVLYSLPPEIILAGHPESLDFPLTCGTR